MKNAIDEILKQYPFIGDDIRREQDKLNNYIALLEDLKNTNLPDDVYNQLEAQCIDGMPRGTGIGDVTGNSAVKIANGDIILRERYQDKINEQVSKINGLIDRQKWLDKAYASLTEDERRIVCLRYNDRWRTWDIMQRMGIKKHDTFYKILDSAKQKIKKIMLT